jgi:hypothetical protein
MKDRRGDSLPGPLVLFIYSRTSSYSKYIYYVASICIPRIIITSSYNITS